MRDVQRSWQLNKNEEAYDMQEKADADATRESRNYSKPLFLVFGGYLVIVFTLTAIAFSQ